MKYFPFSSSSSPPLLQHLSTCDHYFSQHFYLASLLFISLFLAALLGMCTPFSKCHLSGSSRRTDSASYQLQDKKNTISPFSRWWKLWEAQSFGAKPLLKCVRFLLVVFFLLPQQLPSVSCSGRW